MRRVLTRVVFLLSLAATESASGPPKTPAIDYVVPLQEQSSASSSDVIWHDSFDSAVMSSNYFEFVTNGGLFGLTSEEAFGGTGQSLKGLFNQGTVSAGSLKVTFGDSPLGRISARPNEKFNEIHWRVYVKHQRGWTGNPAKLSRATIMAGSNWSQAMIAHVWGGSGNVLTLDPASGVDATGRLATHQYNDFAHLTWLGNKPEGTYPIFATEESGKWVCVEAAAKLNTPGLSDGTFYLWIDGRLDTYRENLNWRGTWDERGINAVFLENYWNSGSPVKQARYFDEFVVSTKPIGLARTGLNPEIVKTAFESTDSQQSQAAMQVQVGAQGGSEVVWDSGTVSGAGNRVRVNATTGEFRGNLAGKSRLEPGTLYAARVRQCDTGAQWSPWSEWRIVIQTSSAAPADTHIYPRTGRTPVPAPRRVLK
jgi:hypothetical protein